MMVSAARRPCGQQVAQVVKPSPLPLVPGERVGSDDSWEDFQARCTDGPFDMQSFARAVEARKVYSQMGSLVSVACV